MDSTRLTWGSFLRITSISVAAYESVKISAISPHKLCSDSRLPSLFALMPAPQLSDYHPSGMENIPFTRVDALCILLLTVSDLGYFYHGFSAAACSTYYMSAPVLKVIQIMISQIIIGNRTWAITRRSKKLGLFLLGLGLVVTGLEWYANVDGRIPVQDKGNCSPGNSRTRMPQWVFYLMAMLFDATTCIISTFFLVRSASGISSMSALVKMLLYDGLGYMVTLTAVNILNLILYRNSVGKSAQSSGAAFGYMVIWIMSQRIIIHIHEAAEEPAHPRIFVTHQIPGPRDIASAMRNQFNGSAKDETETANGDLDVQVQIEQAVMVDYNPIYGREDYRKPRVIWDRKQAQGATEGERTSGERNEWELASVKDTAKTADAV